MSFTKIIRATVAGTSSGPYTIYHTSETAGNIIASSVSRASLLAGVSVTVPDGTTLVIVRSSGTCSNSATVAISQYSAPAIQAYDASIGSIGTTTATVQWTRGNGSKVAVFMKAASSGTPAPSNGTTYTANTVFGSGTQIGSTGWYCIYNGTGENVSVTGLTANTIYRVMALEYNGTSANEVYNTATAANNPVQASTLSSVPSTTTLTFASYSSGVFQFTLSSSVTSNLVVTAASVNGTDQATCIGYIESDDIGGSNNPVGSATIISGSTIGYMTSSSPMSASVINYKRGTSITVNGVSYTNGNTFTVGSTTVTVSIPNTCDTYTA